MNTRPLNDQESENLAVLNSSGYTSILLFVTATGLQKNILDATEPMRRMLQREGIHDYSLQKQGPENKVLKQSIVLGSLRNEETKVSLYRPKTKLGDPRLWFSEFKRFAGADDACAVFVHHGVIYLLNLTRSNVASDLKKGIVSCSVQFIQEARERSGTVAKELLHLLRDIAAKGPLKAVCKGSTAIGRSVETALGIKINSSRLPDYKGIELKSGRSKLEGSETRANLFGCVADWHLSRMRSSKEILDRFGYHRDSEFKLYCSVYTTSANSQGLQLTMDMASNWLKEIFKGPPIEDVCVWDLSRLHKRLQEKHKETFWLKADSIRSGGCEYFSLKSVIHTSNPSSDQFDRLLENGTVSLDHLIKRKKSDKGPLFKIERKRLPELFLGQPRYYSLVDS
jgi:hypothetical protein